MPTIAQLPPANIVSSADEIPISQGGLARAVSVGEFLASTQPAIVVGSPALVGRTSLGPGAPEQVDLGIGLDLAAGTLMATGLDHATFPALNSLTVGADLVVSNQGSPMLMQTSLLRRLFSAGQNVAIDPNGVISASAISSGGSGISSAESISGLPIVASMASQDLVAVNLAGANCAISYSNLLQGLTIDQGQAAGPVADSDMIWAAQGSSAMTAQTFGAIWGWIQGKLPTYRAAAIEIVNNTTLDTNLHNGRLLICSQPVTLNPLSGANVNGFQCTLINASSGVVTLGSGFVSSNGALTLVPWQSASLCCAMYSKGTLTFAAISASNTGVALPGQVSALASTSATSTTVGLTWQAPSVGGAATAYLVQFRLSGMASWNSLTSAGNTTNYQVTSLLASMTYEFCVQAQNASGLGPSSTILAVVTSSAAQTAPPAVVSGVVASPISSSAIQVTWQGQTGPSAAATYMVQYRVSGASTWIVAGGINTGTTATVSSLQTATAYDFSVLGVNSAGAGSASAIASATTASPPQSVNTIVWNLTPSGAYTRGTGAIGVNARVTPSGSAIQFGFSYSSSTAPLSWTPAILVNTNLWGAYVPTPPTAGIWYVWAEGLDGSSLIVNSSPFIVQ